MNRAPTSNAARTPHLRARGGDIELDVLVQPRAAPTRIGPLHGDRLKLAVCAPPVDGAANAAVIELMAAALGLTRGQVAVLRGDGSRRKTLRLCGTTLAAVEALGR